MAGEATVRVLIVDDQAPFRNAARTVVGLTPGFEVVGEASSGEEAVNLAGQLALPELHAVDAAEGVRVAHREWDERQLESLDIAHRQLVRAWQAHRAR